jgi:hypothetical protein
MMGIKKNEEFERAARLTSGNKSKKRSTECFPLQEAPMQYRPPSKNSQLSSQLHNKLNAYALSAAAAGVAIFAATPADAEIVFTPVNGTIAPGSKYQLDLNHDGVIDFTIENDLHLSTTPFGDDLNLVPAKGNALWQGPRELFNQITAEALAAGVRVGTGAPFVFQNANMAYASLTAFTYVSGGPWRNVTNRFLGLRFMIDGQVHFGWARLSVISDSHRQAVHAILTGYAYETEVDAPILTGQIADSAKNDFLTNTVNLGLLALGWQALPAWRRN